MNLEELGKLAAEKQANTRRTMAKTLGGWGKSIGNMLGKGLSSGGKYVAQKPLKRGLPAALGTYALGEGAVSALQGDKALGQQWDDTITRGYVEGGTPGGLAATLKRFAVRPASTAYGMMSSGYTRPDVDWSTNYGGGTPGQARRNPDGSYSRLAEQRANTPWWLKREEQLRQQGIDQQQAAYEKAVGRVQQLRNELEQGGWLSRGLNSYQQGIEAAGNQLQRSLQDQGLPTDLPEVEPSDAQQRYERTGQTLSGQDTGGEDRPRQRRQRRRSSGDTGRGGPEGDYTINVDTRRSDNDVAKALLGAGLPMASLYAASRQKPKTEEERLREAMRMYRQGR